MERPDKNNTLLVGGLGREKKPKPANDVSVLWQRCRASAWTVHLSLSLIMSSYINPQSFRHWQANIDQMFDTQARYSCQPAAPHTWIMIYHPFPENTLLFSNAVTYWQDQMKIRSLIIACIDKKKQTSLRYIMCSTPTGTKKAAITLIIVSNMKT